MSKMNENLSSSVICYVAVIDLLHIFQSIRFIRQFLQGPTISSLFFIIVAFNNVIFQNDFTIN